MRRRHNKGERCAPPSFTWVVVIAGIASLLGAPASESAGIAIRGEVRVAPELQAQIAAGDRLVIKLYHPVGEKAMDESYQIFKSFELPLEFRAAPGMDMSKRTKWRQYVVEAFTDKDANLLGVAEGELVGRTDGTVKLGTSGVIVTLDRLRAQP